MYIHIIPTYSVYTWIYIYIYIYIFISFIYVFIYLSILHTTTSMCLLLCIYFYASTTMYLYLCTYAYASMSMYLSSYLSTYPSKLPCIYLTIKPSEICSNLLHSIRIYSTIIQSIYLLNRCTVLYSNICSL